MKLLHIDSSALGQHSVSRELSAAIVAGWKRRHSGLEVVYRDLAAEPLPHWSPIADTTDPATILGQAVLDEFLSADVVVIGAPMYNFGIPSSLKAWIDRVMIAGKTFRYTENGAEGLAGGKKVIVASSRGGFYGEGSAMADFDFQEAYLRHVLGFAGVTDIELVRAEGIGMGPEQRAKAINDAHAEIAGHLALAA
ncbi:MAG TPA: FMN-dependent NADH-azoreductase [Rhodanobacteraceae bacterium]|nr:FMN-dependent NADH-azoreductase [Rhodanobacteraceae bacterium]